MSRPPPFPPASPLPDIKREAGVGPLLAAWDCEPPVLKGIIIVMKVFEYIIIKRTIIYEE